MEREEQGFGGHGRIHQLRRVIREMGERRRVEEGSGARQIRTGT
jgi:hypothetical protein